MGKRGEETLRDEPKERLQGRLFHARLLEYIEMVILVL